MSDNTISRTGEPTGESLQRKPCLFRRILVAENEPLIRQLKIEALLDSGYDVDAAEDGAVAWQALSINRYDLLITDHHLPDLTGVELIRKLQAARADLPVIMTIGTLPEEELAQYPWLKSAATLLKPYTIAELLGTVKEILRQTDSIDDDSQRFEYHDREHNPIPAAEKPAGMPRQHPANSPRRILVVDDNSYTRQISVDVLVGSGYDVDAAIDGAAGWEALQDIRYDLTVTDNKMPRMTGIEMIEKLCSANMAVPVIMATRHLPTQEFARKPQLKPDASLQRPFSNDELLAAVKKVLLLNDGKDGRTKMRLPKYP